MTAIKPCKCAHSYQDFKYGKFLRVMNFARNSFNKTGGFRCTVCNELHK